MNMIGTTARFNSDHVHASAADDEVQKAIQAEDVDGGGLMSELEDNPF